jgi:hypothetical protein
LGLFRAAKATHEAANQPFEAASACGTRDFTTFRFFLSRRSSKSSKNCLASNQGEFRCAGFPTLNPSYPLAKTFIYASEKKTLF